MNPSLDYTSSDKLVDEIIESVKSYIQTDQDVAKIIRDTYLFARDAHHGQVRKSGEPYITHPLEAVKLLLTLKPDIVSIQACILHDVIEDTPKTKEDIAKLFGEDVAIICE
jgi:GTP diphosphokinase / guanosine-3',5'-bis(diphosphate) 3'-diphosphatase